MMVAGCFILLELKKRSLRYMANSTPHCTRLLIRLRRQKYTRTAVAGTTGGILVAVLLAKEISDALSA